MEVVAALGSGPVDMVWLEPDDLHVHNEPRNMRLRGLLCGRQEH